MDTGSRKWGHPYLTRDFFSRIGASMADQILLVMARRGRHYIAGALNLFGEGMLFGRNWGALEYVPFLHFETCYYQAIDFAIARGLEKVEAGAQGEHKLLRGYMPEETYSAHYIAHKGLRRAVDDFLVQEREAVSEHIGELAQAWPVPEGRLNGLRQQQYLRQNPARRNSLRESLRGRQDPRLHGCDAPGRRPCAGDPEGTGREHSGSLSRRCGGHDGDHPERRQSGEERR